jgi:hypothetical protein
VPEARRRIPHMIGEPTVPVLGGEPARDRGSPEPETGLARSRGTMSPRGPLGRLRGLTMPLGAGAARTTRRRNASGLRSAMVDHAHPRGGARDGRRPGQAASRSLT